MTDNEKLTDFDWVKERAACSAAQMFEKLKLEIDRDVKTRIAIQSEPRYYGFKMIQSDSSFTVLREGHLLNASVSFFLEGGRILAKQSDKVLLNATVTLD